MLDARSYDLYRTHPKMFDRYFWLVRNSYPHDKTHRRVSHSFSFIMKAWGIKSKASVTSTLKSLIVRGLVRKEGPYYLVSVNNSDAQSSTKSGDKPTVTEIKPKEKAVLLDGDGMPIMKTIRPVDCREEPDSEPTCGECELCKRLQTTN